MKFSVQTDGVQPATDGRTGMDDKSWLLAGLRLRLTTQEISGDGLLNREEINKTARFRHPLTFQ